MGRFLHSVSLALLLAVCWLGRVDSAIGGLSCEQVFHVQRHNEQEPVRKSLGLPSADFSKFIDALAKIENGGLVFALTESRRVRFGLDDFDARKYVKEVATSGDHFFWDWIWWSSKTSPRLAAHQNALMRLSEGQRQEVRQALSRIEVRSRAQGISRDAGDFMRAYVRIARLHLFERDEWQRLLSAMTGIHIGTEDLLHDLGLRQAFVIELPFIYGLGAAVKHMPIDLRNELRALFPSLYRGLYKFRKTIGARWLEGFARAAFQQEESLFREINRGGDPRRAYHKWIQSQHQLFALNTDLHENPFLGSDELFNLVQALRQSLRSYPETANATVTIVGSVPSGKGRVNSDLDIDWGPLADNPEFRERVFDRIQEKMKDEVGRILKGRSQEPSEEPLLNILYAGSADWPFFLSANPVQIEVSARDGIFLRIKSFEGSEFLSDETPTQKTGYSPRFVSSPPVLLFKETNSTSP